MNDDKKTSKIISIIVLVAVVVLMAYYFWPEPKTDGPVEFSIAEELKIERTDLTPEETEDFNKRYDDAVISLGKNPEDFWALMEIGTIRKIVGDYRGAEAAWIKVGEISPNNSTSFGNLADLYANFLHDDNKAIENYEIAIQKSLGEVFNAVYVRNYYEFAIAKGDYERAESILVTANATTPKNLDFIILLANFYDDQGDTKKAIEYFEKALEIDPEDQDVKAELNRLK